MPIELERAERVKRFIERFCTYSTGTKFKGKPFKLLPWQYDDVIVPFFSNVDDKGLREYRTCYIEIPKKNGKMLALDTPLPTPHGWTYMGEVKEGDTLLDERGQECRVVGVSEIAYSKTCYSVEFEDGEKIVADADHLWPVTEKSFEGALVDAVLTTQQIIERGVEGFFVRLSAGNPRIGYGPEQLLRFSAIRPTKSVPCRCIAVDSPSHLYLCGKNFIPTHNTELLAALALYFLCADGELGAAVYVAAADREQAGLTYAAASVMVRANETLSAKLKCIDSRKRIVFPKKDGFIQVLSAEVETKHGINPSAVLIDELHAHPNDKLYRYLTSGTDIAREQQAVFVTTTAGVYSKESIWWRQRTHAMQVRDKIVPDPTFLPVLYTANLGDDPNDEELWKRTNPSTGYIFDVEKIRKDFMAVKDRPIEFQDFLRFRLNIPIRQLSKWMPLDKWNACKGTPREETFLKRKCFGGIDLSEKVDLSAFVLLFEPDEDGVIDMLVKFYCPEEGILERSNRDKVPYDIWNKQGYIIATPGATVDYDFIQADIVHTIKSYKCPEIGYDPYKSTDMRNKVMKEVNPSEDPKGFQMVEVRQGGITLHEPCQDLLVNVINKKFRHSGNPVMDWCMDNLVMKSDSNMNLSPDKKTSPERIDGASALATAWSRMLFHRKKRKILNSSVLVTK